LKRWCAGVLVLCWAAGAFAHSRGQTWSQIQISGDRVSVSYSIQATELARLLPDLAYSPALPELLPETIVPAFRLMSQGKPCTVESRDFKASADVVAVTWQCRCASTDDIAVVDDALFTRLPNHIHITQATTAAGSFEEKVFTRDDRYWQITSGNDVLDSFMQYLGLGIEHILTGYDHLAFLLAMILLTSRLSALAIMITGFTIGHSITLAMAVLGYASANSRAVEALIGFTIAMVAAEVVARRYRLQQPLLVATGAGLLLLALLRGQTGLVSAGPDTTTLLGLCLFCVCYLKLATSGGLENLVNPTLTLLFGMIHGFGFAGVLIEVGLPVERLVPALIGFNVGVEVGQLTVLAVIAVAGYLALKFTRPPWYLKDTLASSLCGLGLFWFVARSLA